MIKARLTLSSDTAGSAIGGIASGIAVGPLTTQPIGRCFPVSGCDVDVDVEVDVDVGVDSLLCCAIMS